MHPLADCLPRVLPNGWTVLDRFGDGYRVLDRTGLRVIASTAPMDDGREWLHVSMSREKRLPSYEDMKLVKQIFIGPDKYAYQVFPPVEKFVNIHQFCLHLYSLVSGEDALTDFSMGGASI